MNGTHNVNINSNLNDDLIKKFIESMDKFGKSFESISGNIRSAGTNMSGAKDENLDKTGRNNYNITYGIQQIEKLLAGNKFKIDNKLIKGYNDAFKNDASKLYQDKNNETANDIKDLQATINGLKKIPIADKKDRDNIEKLVDELTVKLAEKQKELANLQVQSIEHQTMMRENLAQLELDNILLEKEMHKMTGDNIKSTLLTIGSGFTKILGSMFPLFSAINDTIGGMYKNAKDTYEKTKSKLSSSENKKVIAARLRRRDGITDDQYMAMSEDDKKKNDEKYNALADSEIKAMSATKSFAAALTSGMQSIIKSCSDYVANQAKAAVEMLKYAASFSSAANQVNTSAINQQLETGLSSADNYGLSMALKKIGLSSYDDYLEYLPFMTEKQKSIFNERLTSASQQYSDWESSGIYDTITDWENTYEEFQYNMQVAFVDFFSENKETITNLMDSLIDAMPVILSVLQSILTVVTGVLNFFGGNGGTKTTTNDIIKNYSNSSGTTVTNNISIPQTYNTKNEDSLSMNDSFNKGGQFATSFITSIFK